MLRTIGLMSGTSLDGVDAAWVETDGEAIGRIGPALTLPYDPALRRDLRRLLDLAGSLAVGDRTLGQEPTTSVPLPSLRAVPGVLDQLPGGQGTGPHDGGEGDRDLVDRLGCGHLATLSPVGCRRSTASACMAR